MPLVKDVSGDDFRLGVWKIAEPASFFMDALQLSPGETEQLLRLSVRRQHEWLASRYVLDQIVEHKTRIETAVNTSGKPFLLNNAVHISLTHSHDHVAAIRAEADTGIDIQLCKEKILAIEHKFANTDESAVIDRHNAVLHLHVLWCAKEALFKIYGRRGISLKQHVFVGLPESLSDHGEFSGLIRIRDEEVFCTLHYLIFDQYVLVYGFRLS